MPWCNNCGTEVPYGSGFCNVCGAPIGHTAPQPVAQPPQFDYERAAARSKSYTGSAVLTFFLYWLFWLPGLIVNIIFLKEAKQNERMAGRSLPGVGCLQILLWVQIILAVLSCCGTVAYFVFGAASIPFLMDY